MTRGLYVSDALRAYLQKGAPDEQVVRATCKTGFAASRDRMIVHRVRSLAATRDGERMRFAARWYCGGVATDVVILPESQADERQTRCQRCVQMNASPAVYRCFNHAGDLLYVGSTIGNVGSRLAAHRSAAEWWPRVQRVDIAEYPTAEHALAAEIAAIRSEHPSCNVRDRETSRDVVVLLAPKHTTQGCAS